MVGQLNAELFTPLKFAMNGFVVTENAFGEPCAIVALIVAVERMFDVACRCRVYTICGSFRPGR